MNPVPDEVAEESQLLVTVRDNLARLQNRTAGPDHDRNLVELRDALAEERLPEDIASIMEQMERTAALRAQQDAAFQGEIDLDSPYFGHMVVDDDNGRRSVLIGRKTFLSDRIRIVDWRNAPISKIFYQYAEGDEYDEEIAGRLVSGEVLTRRMVAVSGGELQRVATDDRTWVRAADDTWEDLRDHEARLAGGAGSALRAGSLGTRAASKGKDRHLPEIASLLDAEQFALITRPDSGVVVIQGSAGSGKTTVGLHRIAYLNFRAPGRFRAQRVMVMVYSEALAAYISQVLPALGVDGVQVVEYDGWAGRLRRDHYKGLPDAYSSDTPALVTRFKLHTAALRLIDRVGRQRRGYDPLLVFGEIFTDRSAIQAAVDRWAPGEFSEDQVKRIHRWCTDQHFVREEGGGPNEHDIPTMDREDDTLLLRLWQVMRGPLRGRQRRPLTYDHIMVDEAQDLSPIELAVVLETAADGRSVTLAGDVAQRIATERDFQDWTQVLAALDLEHIDVSPLQVSYRSTQQIMDVAYEVLGPLAPETPARSTRVGAPVGHLAFTDMGEAVAWLGDALSDLMAREPSAYVAVLAVDVAQAIAWYKALDRAEVPSIGLVDDQEFSFSPGIEVTDIRSAKGLEFDYVVVVGADAEHFPEHDASRHLLHVGATRAAHQLWLVSTGRPSRLIPQGLSGLVVRA